MSSQQYRKAWSEWLDECGEDEPDHEDDFAAGWASAIEQVLKILEQDIQNADLSWETCDERFREKVEEL